MGINLDLIDKVIGLKCPVCDITYQYSLVSIMGFNLDGEDPPLVLGFLPLSFLRFLRILLFGEGETIGVAIASPSPGIVKQLLDTLTKTRARPNPRAPDFRAKIEEKMEKELADPHTYIFTCPKDQKQMQVTLHLDNGEVKCSDPEAASPGNAALFETGKQIQTNSLLVASSFCTSMVGVSTGSVAVYTGLLALVIPKSSSLLWPSDLWSIIPAVGFIVAALLFALGAYPHMGSMRLSFPASIEQFRDDAIIWRAMLTLIAFVILCLALIGAFIFIAWIAGTPASVSPPVSPTGTPGITPTPSKYIQHLGLQFLVQS